MPRLPWLLALALLVGPARAAPAVEILNGPTLGSLEIRASGMVELSSELIVERQTEDGAFEPVRNLDWSSLALVTRCGERMGACVRIDARGLRPIPWSGMSCSSQCARACDKNVRLYGRFRFAVKSCDGAVRFEGPTFEFAERR